MPKNIENIENMAEEDKNTNLPLLETKQQANGAQKKETTPAPTPEILMREPAEDTVAPAYDGYNGAEKDSTPQKIMRTYESDILKALENKNASLANIAMAEQKKIRALESEKGERKFTDFLNKKTIMLAVAVLAVLATTFSVTFVLLNKKNVVPENTMPIPEEIIFANAQKWLNMTNTNRKDLLSQINIEKKKTSVGLGSIINLVPVIDDGEAKRLASVSEFLKILDLQVPSILERSLQNNFMFGLHMVRGLEPFLILKVSSFENAFAGMLGWEKEMEKNFENLFIQRETAEAQNYESSVTSEQVSILEKHFGDTVLKNRDVRVMKDGQGKIYLMYSFPDRNTIIITTNPQTLTEIFDRLTRAKFTR